MCKFLIILLLVVSIGITACSQLISIDPGERISPTEVPIIPSDTQVPAPDEFLVTSLTPTIEAIVASTPTQNFPTAVNPQELERRVSSPNSSPSYQLQAGTPVAMANFIQPEAGCNFMGVGGQPFTLSGQPALQLVVEIGGSLAGSDVFHLQLSGLTPNLGPGGFLITLSDHPIESSGSLWIILYDLAGQPLTEKIYFSTYNDCSRNFILINFVEIVPSTDHRILFPLISR